MSVLGTNLAAGVAQTALNAQQLGRQRDARVREQQRATSKIRDTYTVQSKILEEDDKGNATPRLVVDDQLQERPHPQPQADDKPAKRLDVTG